MSAPSSTFVDVETDALEEVRRALLTLADRQTATLDAIAAQGVRLDALAGAVRANEEQVDTANTLLMKIVTALEGKGEGEGGGMKEITDAVQNMAADVRELTKGTAVMADAVALLARHLEPVEG